MPGFVGICSPHLVATPAEVTAALDDTVYSYKTSTELLCQHPHLLLGRSFFTFLEGSKVHTASSQVKVWVYGEVYNQQAIGEGEEAFVDTLLRWYQNDTLDQSLKQVDGVYLAIIFDVQKKSVYAHYRPVWSEAVLYLSQEQYVDHCAGIEMFSQL